MEEHTIASGVIVTVLLTAAVSFILWAQDAHWSPATTPQAKPAARSHQQAPSRQHAKPAQQTRQKPLDYGAGYRSGHVAQHVLKTLDQSPEAQAQRKRFIQQLIDKGLIRKIDFYGKVPNIWCRPRFLEADETVQNDFLGMIYAYYMVENANNQVLILRDNQGTIVGSYSAADGLLLQKK